MKAVSKHGSSLLSIERTAVMLHPFLHAHPSASCPSPLLHVPPLSFMPCHFASCPAPQLHAPPLCFMPPISFMPHPLLHAPPLCFMPHPFPSCHTHFLHAPPISFMPHPLLHAQPSHTPLGCGPLPQELYDDWNVPINFKLIIFID